MSTFFNNKYVQMAAIAVYVLTMCYIGIEILK